MSLRPNLFLMLLQIFEKSVFKQWKVLLFLAAKALGEVISYWGFYTPRNVFSSDFEASEITLYSLGKITFPDIWSVKNKCICDGLCSKNIFFQYLRPWFPQQMLPSRKTTVDARKDFKFPLWFVYFHYKL